VVGGQGCPRDGLQRDSVGLAAGPPLEWPKYLGGPEEGTQVQLPTSYHQLITNAFRDRFPWRSTPSPQEVIDAMEEIYNLIPIDSFPMRDFLP
jgi:hypothetical protein